MRKITVYIDESLTSSKAWNLWHLTWSVFWRTLVAQLVLATAAGFLAGFFSTGGF